ncbi:amidohydrolase 2 [Lentinula aciculospora]|uniref:Amidohydrolase 2 n=1 Tax=Lentinula aciculospora TaxID=153920 RepID=A0A9W9AFQ1_9AGAR|nr:amidohydrolase 2 [Lentinula aciculospora]
MPPLRVAFWAVAFSALLFIKQHVEARKIHWHDAGNGSIALEEAWSVPELGLSTAAPPLGQTSAELNENLLDIHDQRLTHMDATGVDFMVLSCASPCVQGISDPTTAESLAVHVNDELAAQISDPLAGNSTGRFGAFAALSMHNATAAAVELKRTVEELGFLGALVNDYQQSGANNDTLLFYDQPEYDVFWSTVTELDVPVYFHPRINVAPISTLLYTQAPWLRGASQEFAVTLSNHILGLCTNGVFDRFPALKIIVGHMGERIPSDLDRIDKEIARQKVLGMPMLRNASSYFGTNIWTTSSGSFSPALLEYHKEEIGLDRIMYSIDYPFETMEDGEIFLDELEEGVLTKEELRKFTRETAIALLKLNG